MAEFTVDSPFNMGGLVGYNADTGTISSCYATGRVKGGARLGGLVGNNGGVIELCMASGSVDTNGWWGGGLIGFNWTSGKVSKSRATGSVDGYQSFGGFAGLNWGVIEECSATGEVGVYPLFDGVSEFGFVSINAGVIRDCISSCIVKGEGAVGLFVGQNHFVPDPDIPDDPPATEGQIIHCASVGSIHPSSGPGHFNGVDDGVGTFLNCFWDVEVSGVTASTGATGKTTLEMQQAATFTSAGWDFANIWAIDEGSSYPYFKNRHYTITTTSASESLGTVVSGGGTFYQADMVTVTATSTEYTFKHWEVNGEVISTDASYTFPAMRNTELVAHFECRITVVHPYLLYGNYHGIVVSGSGLYDFGEVITISTHPIEDGWEFRNWTEGGVLVSTALSFQINATSNRNFIPNYRIRVDATSNDETMGSVVGNKGSGLYEFRETARLGAKPKTNYHFVGWWENGDYRNNFIMFPFGVTRSWSLVAHFAINQYVISATVDPEGKAVVDGIGAHDHGSEVTLTANLDEGYFVRNWSEGETVISTEESISFTATQARHFTLNVYKKALISATSSNDALGTVAGITGYRETGDLITLTATPMPDFSFVNWTENGVEVSTDATYEFVASEDAHLVANFACGIVASAMSADGATINGGGYYAPGDIVTLTLSLAEGYHLLNWKDGTTVVSTDESFTFTATKNRTLIANLYQYMIETASADDALGNATGGGLYLNGAQVTVNATATATGYHFLKWTLDGAEVSTSASYTFPASRSGTLIAHFEINEYAVGVVANLDERGSVTGAGTFAHGDLVTVEVATVNDGFTFAGWSVGNTRVSTDAQYSFTHTAAVNLVANFVRGFAGGSGVEGDPYLIATAGQLDDMRYLLDGHFKQVADIDLGVAPWNEGDGWRSIGTYYNRFKGVLDGGGLKVLNLTGGEFFGMTEYATIKNINLIGGSVAGSGALVNYARFSVIEHCYANLPVTSGGLAGGLVGTIGEDTVLSYCGARGDVRGTAAVGGLAGVVFKATITDSFATGDVFASGQGAGGIVGKHSDYSGYMSLLRCHSTGDITAKSAAGGIIGLDLQRGCRVIECYSTGNTSVVDGIAGGILGINEAYVQNSYSYGKQTSAGLASGGISGYSFGDIVNCFSIGAVTGTDYTGGLLGYLSNGKSAEGSFWDTETSGLTTSAGGTGLPTVDMKKKSTFTEAGWDFENIWGIQEGVTYPYLITIPLSLDVSTSNTAHGSATGGGGVYYHQLSATAVATPVLGYRFSHWEDYGETVSTEATYTFTMETHRDLVAHFEVEHTLTYVAGTGGSLLGETPQGVADGVDGSAVEAIADAGAQFLQWSDGVTDNPRTELAVTSDLTVTALFATTNHTPIAWYEQHGMAPQDGKTWSDLDTQDADGDGQNNAAEYLALTIPVNTQSRITATALLDLDGVNLTIKVQPVSSERRYTLYYSPDLSPGSWLVVSGQENRHLTPEIPTLPAGAISAGKRFYKVEVKLIE